MRTLSRFRGCRSHRVANSMYPYLLYCLAVGIL
nr:MAG TPA: hypothetical protein [Caudoviricetes sp.]